MTKITAYADRVSAAPGEISNVMRNCEALHCQAGVVMLGAPPGA